MQDGSVFYRRQQMYSVGGKFPNLADYIIAGCRFGGPLGLFVALSRPHLSDRISALMRDPSKVVAINRVTPAFTKAQIQIYSPAGEGLTICSVDVLSLPG